jgi:hypothetical protein
LFNRRLEGGFFFSAICAFFLRGEQTFDSLKKAPPPAKLLSAPISPQPKLPLLKNQWQ